MDGQQPRWRVGGRIPRNLYIGDLDVGRVDTAEIARLIVATMNAAIDRAGRPDGCTDCGRTARDLIEWWQDGVKLWLGPGCLRRRQAAAGRTVAEALPLGGER